MSEAIFAESNSWKGSPMMTQDHGHLLKIDDFILLTYQQKDLRYILSQNAKHKIVIKAKFNGKNASASFFHISNFLRILPPTT